MNLILSPAVPDYHPVFQDFSAPFVQDLWAVIRSLPVPRKVQIFFWRIFKGILPLKATLCDRHVSVVACCPQCGDGPETLLHVFRTCPFASAVWFRLDFSFISAAPDLSGFRWLASELSSPLVSRQRLFAICLWKLWWFRNLCVHNSTDFSLDSRVSMILGYCIRIASIPPRPRAPPSRVLAVASSSHSFSVLGRFDGSFFASSSSGAGGGILTDLEGNLLASFAAPFMTVSSALHAEALACRALVFLADHLNVKSIRFEGDCLPLIATLQSTVEDRSLIAPIIFDIRSTISRFDSVAFSHIYRCSNSQAHNLARLGCSLPISRVWIFSSPPG